MSGLKQPGQQIVHPWKAVCLIPEADHREAQRLVPCQQVRQELRQKEVLALLGVVEDVPHVAVEDRRHFFFELLEDPDHSPFEGIGPAVRCHLELSYDTLARPAHQEGAPGPGCACSAHNWACLLRHRWTAWSCRLGARSTSRRSSRTRLWPSSGAPSSPGRSAKSARSSGSATRPSIRSTTAATRSTSSSWRTPRRGGACLPHFLAARKPQ